MHMLDRLRKSRKELPPFETDYCVVYEDIDMDCCAIMRPASHAMSALMHIPACVGLLGVSKG